MKACRPGVKPPAECTVRFPETTGSLCRYVVAAACSITARDAGTAAELVEALARAAEEGCGGDGDGALARARRAAWAAWLDNMGYGGDELLSAEGYATTYAFCHGVFTTPVGGEAHVEYRQGCDTFMLLGLAGYWPVGDAPGEGEERLVMDELAAEVAARHGVPVAEVTGAAMPPPGRRLQEEEATLDEDEDALEDRCMSAALGVFLDYRNGD